MEIRRPVTLQYSRNASINAFNPPFLALAGNSIVRSSSEALYKLMAKRNYGSTSCLSVLLLGDNDRQLLSFAILRIIGTIPTVDIVMRRAPIPNSLMIPLTAIIIFL